MLIVMSGLPGVGKTVISRELARATGAVHLRVDTIEQAMRAAGWRVDRGSFLTPRSPASPTVLRRLRRG